MGAKHSRRVHRDSKPVSPFCVFTFVWGCHTESSANSLREDSQVSLQLTAEGRGLLGDRYQFWGWCPFKLQRAAPVRPPRGRITTSIFVLSIYHDLEHRATLRSERVVLVLLPTAKRHLGVTVNLEHKCEFHEIDTRSSKGTYLCSKRISTRLMSMTSGNITG